MFCLHRTDDGVLQILFVAEEGNKHAPGPAHGGRNSIVAPPAALVLLKAYAA